mmetsp:Transcript_12128/g.25678  ORF Transcript_12128/g.25678 Transcript_12128/m.25678 type:complete len:367 (-) Transcript_12128:150-1250(-)
MYKFHRLATDVTGGVAFVFLVGRQASLHGDNIGRRVHILFGVDAVGAIFVTGIISGREFSRNGKCNFALDSEQILSHFQSHVSHFTPVLTPAVADNPVLCSAVGIGSPSHDGDDVVGRFRVTFFAVDPTSVFHDGFRIDCCGNRTTCVDLGHDFVNRCLLVVGVVIDEPVLGYGGIGKVIQGHTLASHASKGVAGLAGVQSGAGGVDFSAEPIGGLGAAGNVGGAGVVRHVSGLLNEFIGAGVVSTVARSGHFCAAVQDKLDAQVDVVALGLAGNLDAVSERRQGSVRPTTPAVLRDVLVEGLRQVALPIDAAPVEGFGELFQSNVGVGERGLEGAVVHGIFSNQDFVEVFSGGERKKGRQDEGVV